MSFKGLNAFATDLAAEECGKWCNLGEMKFLVARTGNDKWKDLQKSLELKAYGSQKRKAKRDEDTDMNILLECLARTCVLGWENVSLDGKSLKFSEKVCVDIILDPRFKVLADELISIATDAERYFEDQVQEDIDNAKK